MAGAGLMEKFSQESDARVLFTHLNNKYPGGTCYSVYESGFCGFSAHYSLMELGIKNVTVNAAGVPATQKEALMKTDKAGAAKSARALEAGLLYPAFVPEMEALANRELVRARSTAVDGTRRYKSRIKHLHHRHGIKYPGRFAGRHSHWTEAFMAWLEGEAAERPGGGKAVLPEFLAMHRQLGKERLETTRKIRETGSKEFATGIGCLCSMPGAGFQTAIAFLTETGGVKRFPNEKKFASFTGIVPACHSSGEKENMGETASKGNKKMRKMLAEASRTAVRRDTALSACCLEYCERVKRDKAIIRIAYKFSNRIFALLKKKEKHVDERNCQ
ncbi:hypothetical protein FACS189435_4580 [Bacteroidia bacterium]|nr:hypothetical protein FACS189435_4580 [Bacteroidia bacterium]